jgi:hypothetical protein
MYETPTVERLGTLREITLGGGTSHTDVFMPNQGCEGPIGGPITCHPPEVS